MSAFDSVKFSGGRPLLKEVSADKLNAILAEIRKNRPRGERGITVRESGSATYIGLAASFPNKTTQASDFPFQILTRQHPSAVETTQWGVVYRSGLFDSPRPDNKVTITGLLLQDPYGNDAGWLDVIESDCIWITTLFTAGGEFDGAFINSWGNGDDFKINVDAWSGENGYCEDDGAEEDPVHQSTRKVIGYTFDGGETVEQSMRQHQLIRPTCVAGRYAQLLYDHSGGYLVQ